MDNYNSNYNFCMNFALDLKNEDAYTIWRIKPNRHKPFHNVQTQFGYGELL